MDTSSTTVATTTDNPLTTLRRGHSSPRSRRSLETPRRRITFAETDDSSARSKESTSPQPTSNDLEDVSLETPRAEAEPHEYPAELPEIFANERWTASTYTTMVIEKP